MRAEARTEVVHTLEKAKGELQALTGTAERGIESVARAFEGLAGHADTILNLAAAIVGSVENESADSVLPKIQTLGTAARRFFGDRLQATTGILETVTTELKFLCQLSRVTCRQAEIALETKELSVLTNIEVARLGALGTPFQYLARELADFSMSVTKDTQELTRLTDGHRGAMEETRRVISADVSPLRQEVARHEGDLSNALVRVTSSLTLLSRTPAQFRACVQEIAAQIAGVTAAVQAHDITRQQLDHVQEAFTLISARMRGNGTAEIETAQELAGAYAGLTIQIYQLRNIRETLVNWASQIRTCMVGILRISASDVVGISSAVLAQEREVSSQLAHIELLQRKSQAHSERLRRTLGGLSNLLELVSEHLQRSKSVRSDRLHLLTFNSIIEARRLGTQAAAILAIANCIKGISAEWGQMTDQSGQTLGEFLNLVKQANKLLEPFSEASNKSLCEAQVQMVAGLESLRTAAAFAVRQARDIKVATAKMQAKITEAGKAVDLLDACYGRIGVVLAQIEGLRQCLEIEHPDMKELYDAVEVEQVFSAYYTTEMERDILRAALRGTTLPTVQKTFAGNGVELF